MADFMTQAGLAVRARCIRRLALSLAFALLAFATPSAAATFNYFPTPIDVSPVVAGAWTDVDVSANVPVGATGVIVQFLGVGADADYGVRMKGSTDNWAFDEEAKAGQSGWLMTGVNAARVFQVYTGDAAVRTYLVGYTMAGVKFFVNRIDKSTATTGTWVDVNIAAETGSDTAIGAIFHVDCQAGSSVGYGLRKQGSTDNRLQTLRANMMNLGLVGVDTTETAQQQIAATTVDLFLVGYVTSGAVFFTNAVDKSTAITGSYQPVDITNDVGAGVANGAFVEIQPSDGTRRNTAIRPNGATYDYYGEVSHQFALVGIDAGDVFEQKIQLNTMDLYLTGYSLADGAGTFRVKSGSYTGTGGALSITGIGFQPDVVIVDSGGGGGTNAVIKTSTMVSPNSKELDNNTAFSATQIVSLDADGFSIGTNVNVNQGGVTYYWVAFEAAPGAMKVGTYPGVAGAQSIGGVGFTPAWVIVMSPNAQLAVQRYDLMPANLSISFDANGFDNAILNVQPNGFGLGTNAAVAQAATTFHYVAFGRVPGRINVGTYTGDGNNNRDILGSGFFPEYVLVSRSSNSGSAGGTSQGNPPAHKTASSGVSVDGASILDSNVFEATNILRLQPDGFRVGIHQRVNNAVAPNNYYWASFGPHFAATYYRSIGTAADLTNQGLITVTNNSTLVSKVGGTGWLAANRGRGDRLTVGTNHYMILRVDSDNQLTLASPAVADYISQGTYTIARQFTTFQQWEDCVSRAAANTCKRPADVQEYFPTTSSSLVADDRREIGIAYKDSFFTPAAQVLFVGATTDTAHTITLTADGINRHNGVAGAGVVIDGVDVNRGFRIEDNNYTVEWLEFRRIRGTTDIAAVLIRGAGTSQTGILLQDLLIHDFFHATQDIKGIGVQGNGGKVATIRNVMIWNGDVKGIEGDAPDDSVTIENCTVNGMTGYGIDAFHSQFVVRNTISVGNPSGDFVVLQADGTMTGANNTSSDTTAASGPRVTFSATQTSVTAASILVAPNSNLHLLGGANTQVNTGLDLSSGFRIDIDGQFRPAGAWDRGADERDATTEVKLQSLAAVAGDASVLLAWRTGSELENLGFHVYRGASADGPWARLTNALIPGLGSSAVGQAYAWTDSGLRNGTRYFYRLEDVDASSVATSHGPVSAVPQAGAPAGEEQGDARDRTRKAAAAGACPAWVLTAYASVSGTEGASPPRCTRHGDPEATAFAVLSRDARQALVELRTGGFYALHEPAGTVRAFVPGFDFPEDEQAAALPLRRALVEAVVGRRVQLAGARASHLVAFPGLVPSAVGAAEMQVSWDGTVRAGRRGGRSPRRLASSEVARLLPSVFQGEAKSAVVELLPLRFDAQRRQLVLARTLRARLLFTGREPGESGSGTRGRAPARRRSAAPAGEVLAQLHTTGRGLHVVAFEQVFAGERRGLPASELRLQRQGEAVAFHVEPDRDSFGPGSRLFFYADAAPASTAFTPELAFELVRSRAGRRMPRASATPSGPSLVTSPLATAAFEVNRFYQPGLLDAPEPWLWEALTSGATRTLPFTLAAVDASAAGAARIDLFLQGASESGRAVDHHVSVSVNGVGVGETSFAGKRPHRASFGLPASILREGVNEFSLTNAADTGVSSLVFIDRFRLAFPRLATAVAGRFEGEWAHGGAAAVAVAEQPLALLEVPAEEAEAAADPVWLSGYEVGAEVRFRAEAARRYLLVTASGALAPRIARPQPSTLRSTSSQADYLLIAPRAFLPTAEPLLARRADQGLAARGVAAEEIYDAFGHGQPSAEAIRAFVAFAFQSWARPSPRYVLLLGDASYDPRNFMGASASAPLPTLFEKTAYLWTSADPLLGAVNGDDMLPDLAIGRLPAATSEEAGRLVEKLLAWEDSAQGLLGRTTLVADNPDLAGDFEANAADVAQSFLADRQPELLLLRELGASTRPRILDSLNAGLALLSYVGHGGAAVWASENVWNSWDAASLQAQSRQPLLLTWNCLNGYFVAPAFDSLAESLVKAEGRGAIAAVSPSGLSLDAQAHAYHRALMAELTSGQHARLGDAFLAAQTAYGRTGLMPELLSIYHLFGDPAMPLR